ncbi:MAG: hypothetical protein CM1200mP30_04430 [Pseudomonadota bacterium]|nr:MAG: hypothetical protein CM1200mP30_04430 [Pseudomonadota bacterium]
MVMGDESSPITSQPLSLVSCTNHLFHVLSKNNYRHRSGTGDAIGILLALASPEELDLLGIVTVAGKVPLEFKFPKCINAM